MIHNMDQNKKQVRFKSIDQSMLQKITPVVTNTFSSQTCEKCGTVRFNQLGKLDTGCKNCEIPFPRSNTVIQKSEFLSRSLGNLKKSLLAKDGVGRDGDEQIVLVENPNEIPQLLTSTQAKGAKNINCKPLTESHKEQSSWKCASCKGYLLPGETAIKAKHIDPNARWHPHCFACTACRMPLGDELLYYFQNNKIYCEADFERLQHSQLHVCVTCNLPIVSNEYIRDDALSWHLEHFICHTCERSLLNEQQYILTGLNPHCLKCHAENFTKTCQTCNGNIPAEVQRFTYENLNWHEDEQCFKCAACERALLNSPFLIKNNMLFCSLECKRLTIALAETKTTKKKKKKQQPLYVN